MRGYRRGFHADIPATVRQSEAARVQKKISRGYTRDRAEKCSRAGTEEDFAGIYPRPRGKVWPRGYRRRFHADIPANAWKSVAARVQKKISRVYTRNRAEKCGRAGTEEDFTRIYPQPCGKVWPRGYRRRFRGYIPATARKSVAARVQKKISRGYTRECVEKCGRAGTEEDFARIYPQPCGKVWPRGYRRGFHADIPATVRKSVAARVQKKISRVYTRNRVATVNW